MENLTYVTGNYGKYISVKEHFENNNINIDYYKCDLEEPNVNDIKYISKTKAEEAFELLGVPVIVADSGFYIENYPGSPGYPGAFVKRSNVSTDILGLLQTMKDVTDRSCYFLDCLTYFDGVEFRQFFGKSEGTLSYEKRGVFTKRSKSNLWYVFIPKNSAKTLGEMTEYEIAHRNDDRTSATEEFIKWYKENKNIRSLKNK